MNFKKNTTKATKQCAKQCASSVAADSCRMYKKNLYVNIFIIVEYLMLLLFTFNVARCIKGTPQILLLQERNLDFLPPLHHEHGEK